VNLELGTACFVHKGIISEVNMVGFVSDGMSCIILRGCGCNIVILKVLPQQRMKLII
jgi:hypothetical protein